MGNWRNVAIAEQHPTGLIAPMGPQEHVCARVYKIEAHSKQNGRCAYCREPMSLREATADHVVPRAHGGLTCAKNIKSACDPCNGTKGSMTEKRFKQVIRFPAPDARLGILLANYRLRLWSRTALAEKRILASVGL